MTLQIATLASGTGSNVAAILQCIEDGRLDARVAVVVSNNPAAGVLDKAQAKGVPVWVRDNKQFGTREEFDRAVLDVINEHMADTIVLAGYMRMLSPVLLQAYPGRILNIHPALLPSFAGVHGGSDALAHGVRFSGATVHFVDEGMDSGPIIVQAVVPVSPTDTEESLMPRIHAVEHRIYPQALQWLAEGRLRVKGRNVHVLPGKKPQVKIATCRETLLGPYMVCPELEGF